LDGEFEEWWELYPRKDGKADALAAYVTARGAVSRDELHAATQAYALLNITTPKAFVKAPAGWLRGKRWEDAPTGPVAAPEGPKRAPVRDCPVHPGYPASERFPCAACERQANDF